jgi:hypothetical protein
MHTFTRAFLPAILISGFAVNTYAQQPAELFGIRLADTNRTQLREALKKNNVPATRVDDNYWVDLYDASDTLKEAKELSVGYVAKTGRFAYAEYKFESFMDTDQVRRVIEMVGTKYGKPSSFRGSYGLGNVSAQWNLPGGINLEVRRGWPSTTTYLTYSHSANYAAMRQEIQAQEKRQQQQEAQRQSKAF